MRRIGKLLFLEAFGLYAANKIAAGLTFEGGYQSVAITIAALAIASYFVRPIINILILPLSLATLGLFKFIGHAITLYLVDLVLPQFSITGFVFDGFSSSLISFPPISLPAGALAYIGFALVLSIITTFIHWIVK